MDTTESERAFLSRVLRDVLDGAAFFSLGEMTTITGWQPAKVGRLSASLTQGQTILDPSEQRFIRQALYAWLLSARKGRLHAADDLVEVAEALESRLRKASQDRPAGQTHH